MTRGTCKIWSSATMQSVFANHTMMLHKNTWESQSSENTHKMKVTEFQRLTVMAPLSGGLFPVHG